MKDDSYIEYFSRFLGDLCLYWPIVAHGVISLDSPTIGIRVIIQLIWLRSGGRFKCT